MADMTELQTTEPQLPAEPSEAQEPKQGTRFLQGLRRDRAWARLLAQGYSIKEVAEKTGFSKALIYRRCQEPDFIELVQQALDRLEQQVEEQVVTGLVEAELEAVETLRELMQKGKDEKVRFQAAESVLNRAGRRGKPADTQQVAKLDLNKPLDQALSSALADPTVQKALKERPELLQRLGSAPAEKQSNVKLLPAFIESEDATEES